MNKIFRPDVSNSHQPILLSDSSKHEMLATLNFRKMSDEWVSLHFDFFVDKKKKGRRPDITNMMPCIAFREELRESIFPVENADVELLPIVVSGEDWLIVNCLRSTSAIVESKSVLHRDGSGTIFMVQKLVVLSSELEDAEIFTVDGSNRSYSFLVDSFVNRVVDLKLEGLTFAEIGETI